jgi:hypothetical protein
MEHRGDIAQLLDLANDGDADAMRGPSRSSPPGRILPAGNCRGESRTIFPPCDRPGAGENARLQLVRVPHQL